MIRAIRPTDFGALLRFERQGYQNAAQAMSNLARGQSRLTSFGNFVEQWLSLDENRQTWISKENGQIDGVASGRTLGGRHVLEIDRLLFPETGRRHLPLLSLFDFVTAVSAENGIQRVFLRLDRNSPIVDLALRAGYQVYTPEVLYTRGVSVGVDSEVVWPEGMRLRRRHGSDDHQLFRLYNAAVPGRARQAEGLTLAEWKQVRDRRLIHHRTQDYVVEDGPRLIGWLRIGRRGRLGQIELLIDPSHEAITDLLIRTGLRTLGGWMSVACLVPEYQVRVARVLQEHGFEPVTEYYSLVKQIAARVRYPALVPVRA